MPFVEKAPEPGMYRFTPQEEHHVCQTAIPMQVGLEEGFVFQTTPRNVRISITYIVKTLTFCLHMRPARP